MIARPRGADLAAHEPTFAVGDTLRAMVRLGVAARARAMARVVAVTGSVGKTSAKEMLRVALGRFGLTHASAASYNNHWGVPLTLSRLPAGAAFAVVEIGMNHAGEITPLVAMARPQVALVTTIAPVHIEHLGSLEGIADAKAEIFSGLEPGGVAVLNRDAPQFERLAAAARARGARIATFGADADCDAQLARRRVARRRLARARPCLRPRARFRPRRAGPPHGRECARRARSPATRSASMSRARPPRWPISPRSTGAARVSC